jgi:hypothetical protein
MFCANSCRLLDGSPYLRRYKTCASAEEVVVMQEVIITELEESYEVSRREKGMLINIFHVLVSHV